VTASIFDAEDSSPRRKQSFKY